MFRSRVSFQLRLLLILLLAGAVAGIAEGQNGANTGSKPAATASAQYVGSETCKGCHEDLGKGLATNPHYELIKGEQKSGTPEEHGCESCHGPGSAHVEGGGDKTKIFSFQAASVQQSSAQCLTCHQKGHEQEGFARSVHLTNGVGCISCHSVHAPKVKSHLLQASQPALCYQCHNEQKAEFNRPFRHRVNEGLVQCGDCHNVHGSVEQKQLRTSLNQDQVCFKCHTDKRGPFVFEHLPVKTEGCQSCHTPHGSTNPKLLRVNRVNLLCLQCHTLSTNANVPSQPPIGPAHNQNQKYQACTMCHAFIHGSNFSEVFFKP